MNVDHHKVHYRPRASKTNLAVKMTVRPSPLPARSLLGTNSVPACFSSLQPSLLTSLLPVGPSIALAHARPHLAARARQVLKHPNGESGGRPRLRPGTVERTNADDKFSRTTVRFPVSRFGDASAICAKLRGTLPISCQFERTR